MAEDLVKCGFRFDTMRPATTSIVATDRNEAISNVAQANFRQGNFTDATGKTTRYHGDVAQTFEKVGGQWRLKLASWNVLPDSQ